MRPPREVFGNMVAMIHRVLDVVASALTNPGRTYYGDLVGAQLRCLIPIWLYGSVGLSNILHA
jgi:hypothetical protein